MPENVKTKRKLGKNNSIDRVSKQSWNSHRAGMAKNVGMKNKDITYARSAKQSLVPVDHTD